MQFCSGCGQAIERRVPAGDDRERCVCAGCGTVHYQNPRMVVGCVVVHAHKVLLCKRAIEPRRGYWTLPAGFLELGESTMEGAVRETREEARADVRVVAPYAHFDVPHIGQAYVLYRAELTAERFGPGPESLEVRLVAPDEIPWSELAFPVVRHVLELVTEELRDHRFRAHVGVIAREAGRFALRDHLAIELRG
jgi:ADP-ribose/FAD diphosphatase